MKRIDWGELSRKLTNFRAGEGSPGGAADEELRQLNRWLGSDLDVSDPGLLQEMARDDPVLAELGWKIAPGTPPLLRRSYHDFAIHFSVDDLDSFTTQSRAMGSESKALFESPWTAGSLEEWLKEALSMIEFSAGGTTRHARNERFSAADPTIDFEAAGQRLFKALITEDLRRHYDGCLGMLRGGQRGQPAGGLRIKLCLDPNDPSHQYLDRLPWELLWDRSALALGDQTLVVRYLDLPSPPRPLSVVGPLRVLVVRSCGEDEPLDLEEECRALEDAWSIIPKTKATFDFLQDPSATALEAAVGRRSYHVLHFMGHGTVDEGTGRGCLELRDRSGATRRVSGRLLGDLLRRHDSLRLVVLNACESSAFTREHPGVRAPSGVAQELVASGCPAVVAMQFPVSDSTAILFAQAFYEALVDGLPVDAAVARGRMAIRLENEESWEWITPVVYMRLKDGFLFRP